MSHTSDAVHGAIAGLNGAACMSAVRAMARRFGLVHVMPPQALREALTGETSPSVTHHVGDHLLHVAVGVAGGAAFGTIAPRRGPANAAAGVAFGVGMWAMSLLVLVPVMRAKRGRAQLDVPQSAINLLAHAIYGGVLALMVEDFRVETRRRAVRSDREMARVG
jgi:hypothetical protein